ncbi:uncharacterized protein LOC119688183 [Teleopsis dalmanni]|uniref:uncharacterized protein LOC119688183 n=1 Tax=Teleopsis dalmanni TaxID=139649 RepID=UPI0018CD46B3|nr:uncharacterized protein LOC119688183 [Teleopsis dalmanni]
MSFTLYDEPHTDEAQKVDTDSLEAVKRPLVQVLEPKYCVRRPNTRPVEYSITPIMSYIDCESDRLSLKKNPTLNEKWIEYIRAQPISNRVFAPKKECAEASNRPKPRKFSMNGKSFYDNENRPCPVPAVRRDFGTPRVLPKSRNKP